MKPVYIINGFLESGKTEFIRFTLSQPYFRIRGTTLLLLCEEGETEYEAALLKKSKTIVETFEEEEEFTPEKMAELDKTYKPERIIIEYNGMWNFKELKLPKNWRVEQQITTINAATFPMYYTNMKSLLADQVRNSEMIIFNRCDGLNQELSGYKRNIKAVNQRADIIFEDKDGEINEMMEEELPYDIQADIIELDDMGYGIWYLDTIDHLERYEGKTIRFLAQIVRKNNFPKQYFIPGRMAMTCCAEDMTFLGYIAVWDKADTLKDKDWAMVTARVENEYFEGYGEKGPVLHAVSVEPAKKPKEEIISFM